MFFMLSKLLDLAVDPLWVCALLVAGGRLLRRRARRVGAALGVTGLLLLWLCSTPTVAGAAWKSLEAGVVSTASEAPYDAVVLLGGVVSPSGSTRDEPGFNDNFERVLAVRSLLLNQRAKVAIVSGGELGGELPSEARIDIEALVSLGVDSERLLAEPLARNTKENAELTKPMLERLGAKRVLLVTSAHHMPRAVGCFRAVGVEADVYPVDFHARTPLGLSLLPRAESLGQTARALREWLGRATYWALGYART